MCLLLSPPSGFIPSPWSIQQKEASQGLRPPLFSNNDAYTTISNMGQLLTPPAAFCSVPAQLLELPCCIHSLWGTRPYKLLGGLSGPAKVQQRQHLCSEEGPVSGKGCGDTSSMVLLLFPMQAPVVKPAAEPRASSTAAPAARPHAAHLGAENSYITQEQRARKAAGLCVGGKG